MNNAVFGKTMENVRNRINMVLINNDIKRVKKYTAKPNYKKYTIFNDPDIEEDTKLNVCAIHLTKNVVELNKPILIGQSILDLSKLHMYNFYYNVLKKRYNDNIKLLFTDTDSLCFEVQTEDYYKDMQEQKEYYDLSEYDKSHFLYDPTNAKVLGKFKDEMNGSIIEEFVGLRSKVYSLKIQDKKDKKVNKGVNSCVIKNVLTHEDYYNCLIKQTIRCDKMNNLRSKHHQIYACSNNKITLSSVDNKRFQLDDGIASYAYNHYKIDNVQ